jgi:hypothetical protein
VLCAPPHWQALSVWSSRLGAFLADWNKEAAALRAYQKTREQLEAKQKELKDTTAGALDDITSEAASYLMGGRLRYRPAGGRGYICVVLSSEERALPAFTLPALTASKNLRLGTQVSLAAARMMPAKTESTLPGVLDETGQTAQSATEGLGGVVGQLLKVAGQNSTFVLKLWGSCLGLYTKGSRGLETIVSGLPWGLDSVFAPALRSLSSAAQISPPDLRRLQPVLVDSSQVGDSTEGGLEGSLVRTLQEAKNLQRKTHAASAGALSKTLEASFDELTGNFLHQIEELGSVRILGVRVAIPFSEQVFRLCSEAVAAVRSRGRGLLAGVGGGDR